jgi:LPPG:FO 2-phospho-L-lactate transferase
VVNTGDDFEHLGFTICPDLDTVTYTLAGIQNRVAGWGRDAESWHFMAALETLGGETWFRLGDRDLAVHVVRTVALSRGMRLSDITLQLAARFGVRHPIVPMCDTPVRTKVVTARGELDFQDYFVRFQCRPRVRGFRYAGSRTATVPQALRKLVQGNRVRAVILCPSNPYVSIAPILAVPEIGRWLRARAFPVVGISPIVGGAAIKGPAAKMMRELREPPSALGVARHYGALVDGWIIDEQDANLERAIERLGKATLVTDTIMASRAKSMALAMRTIRFAQALA